MRKIYVMQWEVDGSSGSTEVLANCKAEVLQYFAFNFGRFGYVLKSTC